MARFLRAKYWMLTPGAASKHTAVPHEIIVRRAHLLSIMGRWEKAESELTKCMSLEGIRGQQEVYSQMLLEMTSIRINQGRLTDAVGLIADYEAMGLDSTLDRLMNLTNLRGKLAFYQGDLAAAKSLFLKVLELSGNNNQQLHKSRAGQNLGNISILEGDLEAAEAFYLSSLALSEGLGDICGIGMVLGGLGIVAAERGEHQKSLGYFRRDLDIGLRLGQQQTVAQTFGNIGQLFMSMERLQEAMGSFQDQMAITKSIGDAPGTFNALYCLACCSKKLGRLAEAESYYEQSIDHGRQWSMVDETAKSMLEIAELLVGAGKVEAAKDKIDGLLNMHDEVRDKSIIEQAHRLNSELGQDRPGRVLY